MIRGLYAVTSGLLAASKSQDAIANNLANASTTAFKKDTIITESFPNLLMMKMDKGKGREIGSLGTGLQAITSHSNLSQGALQYTGNELNFAIAGPGYFVLETPEGPRYTRDGLFQMDEEGYLTCMDGNRVLGSDGEAIRASGVTNQDIRVVDLPQEVLQKLGHNKWRLIEGAPEGLEEVSETRPQQGYLEQSNVNIIKEMTEMIRVVRLYEAGQKAIQAQDETLGKAVNEIGRF